MHRCLWKEFCLQWVLIWILKEQDKTLWLTPLFCTRCLGGSFQSKRFPLLEGVWRKSRFHSFLGFGFLFFFSYPLCKDVRPSEVLLFCRKQPTSAEKQGYTNQCCTPSQSMIALLVEGCSYPREASPLRDPKAPNPLKNEGRMSPRDSPKVCQEPLVPAFQDAPPSISLMQMLGDVYSYSPVSLSCFSEDNASLAGYGTLGSGWPGCLVSSRVFCKIPCLWPEFSPWDGFIQSLFLTWWEHWKFCDLPSPLPPGIGSEGEKGGMLCRELTLFIYHQENTADKQRDSFWCQPTINLFAC